LRAGDDGAASRRLALDAVFLGSGALAIAAQVLLLRELMVALAGDEASLGVGLAAWLLGIALGAALARRAPPGRANVAAGAGLAILAVIASAAVPLGRVARGAFAPPPGEIPGLGMALASAAGLLAPAGAGVGWTFTSLASVAADEWAPGFGIARLYVGESAGSLAGGLLVTFAVIPWLGPMRGMVAVGALALALALPAVRCGVVGAGRALVLAFAGLLSILAVASPLDRWTQGRRFAGTAPGLELKAARDTPYAHLDIGVSKSSGDVEETKHLYAGGQYALSFPDPYANEALAHILVSVAARPVRLLALGGLVHGPLRYVLESPVESVALLEADARALEFLEPELPAADRAALRDPRVHVVHDDPRRFLATTGEAFDLILSLGPDPVTLLRARLTTREFYRLCARRLSPEGALVVAVKTAPNLVTGETGAMAGAVFRALSDALPVVRATPGPETLLVAGWSDHAVTLDPATLAERFRERGVRSASFGPELFPVLFPPARVRDLETDLRRAARQVGPSSDHRPVSFAHALARRQRETGGILGRMVGALGRLPVAALVALALLPSVGTLVAIASGRARRPGLAARHVVAVTGGASMAWSLLVLFAFQTAAGTLYGWLGLLTALFMLGLATGAHTLRESGQSEEAALRRLRLAAVFALLCATTLALALTGVGKLEGSATSLLLAVHGGLLLLVGLATGALFPAAAGVLLAGGETPRDAAGRLEAADHLGAGVAALLAAVVFIPTLGLVRSAWLVVVLEALGLAGVAMATPRPRP
jgi:spermidine synthase